MIMRGIKHILFTFLAVVFIASGGAFASQQTPTYPTAYWISGSIAAGNTGLTDLSSYTVVFYKNSDNAAVAFASAVTDATGNFLINAHDDLNLLPLSAADYFMAITSKSNANGKSYGLNQTSTTLSDTDISNGYKQGILLTLAENQGPPPIVATTTGSVSGEIIDPATGNPVANTGVTVYVDGVPYTTTTDAQGNFTVDNIPTGTQLITIGANGGTKSLENTISAGATSSLGNITPVPGGTIAGTLTDSMGNVLASKEVTMVMTDSNGKISTYTTTTNAQGDFAIDGIPAGTYSTITLTSEGLTKTFTNKEIIKGQAVTLSGTLAPLPGTGGIVGIVVDSNGKAIIGAMVTTDGINYAKTNSFGSYILYSLPPGNSTVHASANGFEPNSISVLVKEGKDPTPVDTIILSPLATGKGIVNGFVTDGSTPLLGAKVEAGALSTVTASDGYYHLTVDKGTVTLNVSLVGYKPAAETTTVDEKATKQINFHLEPLSTTNNGTVSGVISDQKTKIGISGATVSDGTRKVDSDSSGNYIINNVPAGNYTIKASANGYIPNERDIPVSPGQPIKVNLPLTALPQNKAVIYGNVLDNNGAKLSAFKVEAKGDAESPSVFGIDGTYQLTLSSGSYVVTSSLAGYKSASQTISIIAGETRPLDFTLEKITAKEPNPKVEVWFGTRLYQKSIIEKGGKFITASKPEIKINVSVDDPYTLPQDLGDYGITIDPGSAAAKTYNLTAKNIAQKVMSTQKLAAAGIATTEKIRGFTLHYTIADEIPDGSHVIAVTAKTSGALGIAGIQTESASIEVMGGPLRVSGPILTYPSPFSITQQKTVQIQYTLSSNSDVDIYLTGVNGMRIKKFTFFSGTEGGTAGTNKVTWDGMTDQGFIAGNAIYVGTLISRTDNKLLGKFKLTIVD